MRGINLAEAAHTVQGVAPVDFTGGKDGAWVKLEDAAISMQYQQGVAAGAATKILVEAAADNTGTDAEAIPFSLYSAETTDSDVLGAREDVAATGKTPSANNNIFYRAEVRAEELPEGKKWVRMRVTAGATSIIGAIVYTLTGLRYGGPQSPSVKA